MRNWVSHGYIADDNDDIGPLFEWYDNGDESEGTRRQAHRRGRGRQRRRSGLRAGPGRPSRDGRRAGRVWFRQAVTRDRGEGSADIPLTLKLKRKE